MNNRNQELIKNSLILGFGTLVPKLLSLLILPILTSFLTTAEYGNYDLINSFVGLFIPIITLQIQQAAFRFLISSKNKHSKESYIITSLVYILIICLVTSPIVFFIFKFMEFSTRISMIICFTILAESMYLLMGQLLRGLGYNLKYSIGVIAYSIVNFLTVLIFVYYFNMGLFGLILSVTSSYMCSTLVMLITVCKEVKLDVSRISKERLVKMLKFSAPILPSSISLWIVNLSDRLIVVSLLGSEANGIYSVANKIPALYSYVYSIFNLSWTETAARVSDSDSKPEMYYSELFAKLYDFLIGIMLVIIAASPLFYKIFINQQYYDSYFQSTFLYFGVFFNSIVSFYSGIYIAIKRTKQVGISSAMGAIINIVVNLLLINSIGLYAASISTAISFFVIMLYRAYDINKVLKLKYNYKQIVIGMSLLVISLFLYFQRTILTITFCFIIAIIFNIRHNKYMMFWILNKIKRV